MSEQPTPAGRATRRRHYLVAVVGSIVLHALVAAVLASMPEPTRVRVEHVIDERPEPVQIDVQIVERPAAPTTPHVAPPAPKPPSPPVAPTPRKRRAARADAAPFAPSEPVAAAVDQGAAPSSPSTTETGPETERGGSEAEARAEAPAQDVPRLRSLVPGGDFIAQLEGPRAPASGTGRGTSTGRTLQNTGDPDGSQARARREADARAGRILIDGWAREDLAELRVRNGAVDDYFRELGDELERLAQVNRPLQVDVKEGLQRAVEGYLMDAERYGATGAPVMPKGLGDQEHHTQNPDREGTHAAAANAADQYARVQELVQRFGAGELVVIVELKQDAQGRIVELVVVRSSGDPLFDAHIQRVASGMNAMEGMPDHVAARSPHGVRTTWEFRGRYNFRKKLRHMDVNDPGDAAYIAAMGLSSLVLGGSFDEVTGDIYIVDVRDPKFEVRSRLLRLY